ncbi:AMP-binding protein, partial [Mesorhizobium sp. M3A.F.Ca.ET.201.01.1.1]|uniref:AMP-binding protein n=1 Tax=Mesorhizobium sp. M3A.F.Ca.ET.201.01.1.1 TaxID=2563946 RepID=UPI001139417F
LATAEPGRLKAKKLPSLEIVIRMGDDSSPGMFNFGDVLAMAGRDEHDSLDRISESLKPNEAINIQFTSGTTGAPKGATLTHLNIVNNGNFVTSAIR